MVRSACACVVRRLKVHGLMGIGVVFVCNVHRQAPIVVSGVSVLVRWSQPWTSLSLLSIAVGAALGPSLQPGLESPGPPCSQPLSWRGGGRVPVVTGSPAFSCVGAGLGLGLASSNLSFLGS